MMDVDQFRHEIVRPVIRHMGLWSPAAENLLVGTAIVESGLRYVRQLGGGPALGFFQMEPATHDDIWVRYLSHREDLAEKASHYTGASVIDAQRLVWNTGYACAMARVHYWRRPEPLPHEDDIDGLAAYWKQHFNTRAGAGKAVKFASQYRKHGIET